MKIEKQNKEFWTKTRTFLLGIGLETEGLNAGKVFGEVLEAAGGPLVEGFLVVHDAADLRASIALWVKSWDVIVCWLLGEVM